MNIKQACLQTGLALFVLTNIQAQVPVRLEDHRLEPNADVATYDWYGWNVELYRDRAAVASRNDSTLASGAGAVNVYLRRSHGWELLQQLLPSDVAWSMPVNYFGQGMAMEGDWLFVGAPHHDLPHTNDGAVYSYRWNGGRYEFFQKIQPPDFGLFGNFGTGVAYRGGDLYIGKPGDDVGGSFFGAVYVFRWNGTGWAFLSKETNYDQAFRNFGWTLALDGDLLAVGSVHRVSIMQVAPNGQMTRQQYIHGPIGPTDFGQSVALEGDVLVVGQPRVPNWDGRAYVYRRMGAVFVQEQILLGDGLSPPGYSNKLGWDVAIRDGLIVVGAPRAYDSSWGRAVGRAFVYEHNGSSWIERERLEPESFGNETGLGSGVALHDGTILIGAMYLTVHGIREAGAGLVYELPIGTLVCAGQLTSTGSPATLHVHGVPAVVANAITLKAQGVPGPGLAVFLAGVELNMPVVVGNGLLCLGSVQRIGTAPVTANGRSELSVDLTHLGTGGTQPGDQITFQTWFRDASATGTPTSNLSGAVEVTFY